MRIGLIGAGRWGRVIVRSLEEIPEARLVRIATRSSVGTPELPQRCVTTDFRAVATADDVDGVIIATPPAVHAEVASMALLAGKAVLVEKPMTQTVKSSQALLDLVRDLGGIVRVNHVDLHNPAWTALKGNLDHIGALESVDLAFGGPGPFREDVTPCWDWGAHPLALLYDLLGAPISVTASRLVGRKTSAGFVERVRISVGHLGGVPATVCVGNAFPQRRRSVEVHGSGGSLVYDDQARVKLRRTAGDVSEAVPVAEGAPLTIALERFVASVQRGAPDWQDAVLGLSVVSTLSAVDRALGRRR